MSIEAMKLALEALENLRNEASSHNDNPYCGLEEIKTGAADEAIKALEAALEAHKALAKQEQRNVSEHMGEPVGIVESAAQGAGGFHVKLTRHVMPMIGEILYTAPQQRKPLTDEQIDDAVDAWFKTNADGSYPNWRERMRAAIEAAHGIKE